MAHKLWELREKSGLKTKWKIMAIRLGFLTFTDIWRNTDKWRMSIQADSVSAMLIIQKWQMFVKGVGKRFESDLLCYGNKLGLWYRLAFLFGIPNVGKSGLF
jgi:predicted membrane protein